MNATIGRGTPSSSMRSIASGSAASDEAVRERDERRLLDRGHEAPQRNARKQRHRQQHGDAKTTSAP